MLVSQLRCVPVCFIVAFPCAAVNILLFLPVFDGAFPPVLVGTAHGSGIVYIEKRRADVGIGPYQIVAFVARAKASRFCLVMPFLIPADGRITPYTGRGGNLPPAWAKEKSRSQKKSAFGGHEGSRTLDLCNANAALSQLSYAPVWLLLYHAGGGRARGKLKFIAPIPPRCSAAGCGAKKLPLQGSAREVGGKITFAFS